MLGVIVRLVADAVVMAVLLFVPAGTFNWWRGWVLVVVSLAVRIITAVTVYRVHPGLVRERARLPVHRDQRWADRVLVVAILILGFAGVAVIAALDVFHWHLLPRPAPLVADGGLVLFTLGWALKGLALRANAFATTVVRIQHEREHALVDTGVYDVVRHPFYTGTLLVFIGLALWLESFTAMAFAFVPIVFVLIRLHLEERVLRRELAGYREYALRVQHRLLPGIW